MSSNLVNLMLVGVTAASAAMATAIRHWDERNAGAALFSGQAALEARVGKDGDALPAAATACQNCHGSENARGIGPALNATFLQHPQVRRGGPPSHYDENSFCQLLRTGVDPAAVIVPMAMPRYNVSAAQCHTLWAHLTKP